MVLRFGGKVNGPRALVATERNADAGMQSLILVGCAMLRDDVIAALKEAEPALRARGIRHAAVFWFARAATITPTATSIFWWNSSPAPKGRSIEYIRLKEFIASLFNGPVDMIDRDALKPHLRAPAARDTFYAF
jgi:hypothetical protein